MGNGKGHVNDNHPQKRPKKLLDRSKEILRRKHYSIRTEEAYIDWMVRIFGLFRSYWDTRIFQRP
jgi:hypothetical protein